MKKHFLSLILLGSLVACSSEKSITVTINPIAKDIKIHSDLVTEYFNQESYDYKDMNAYINGRTDQGDNLPIEITWSAENVPTTKALRYALIFNDGVSEFSLTTTEQHYSFTNYKLNTKYTLTIHPAYSTGSSAAKKVQYEFTTPDGYLRTITIDGVTNFRDLGDGKKMKQGLIYRSATLTNNTSTGEDNPTSITSKGKKQLLLLDIKTRIDLRKDNEKAVGEEQVVSKQIVNLPLHYGGNNILTYKNDEYNNPENIKNVFNILADEANYPLDIHCVRGTDRTGCIAYLVKGLLGIDEEMLYRDFLFSNFYNIGSPVKLESIYYATNPNATTRYVNVIHQTEGETLKDKIYNYLSSDKVGVSASNLDKIINLLKV